MNFRSLRADEIEVRVSQVSEKGCGVLLYKDARCDMNILDETLGTFGWQRDHKELKGNMYAGIGIYDAKNNQWVWKWDCGKESYAEAEKGEASDSFKRAGFNWGIGRELYTAPFIWFSPSDLKDHKEVNGRWTTYDRFYVQDIVISNHKILYLEVKNQKSGAQFTWCEKGYVYIMIADAKKEGAQEYMAKLKEHYKVDDLNLLKPEQVMAIRRNLGI